MLVPVESPVLEIEKRVWTPSPVPKIKKPNGLAKSNNFLVRLEEHDIILLS